MNLGWIWSRKNDPNVLHAQLHIDWERSRDNCTVVMFRLQGHMWTSWCRGLLKDLRIDTENCATIYKQVKQKGRISLAGPCFIDISATVLNIRVRIKNLMIVYWYVKWSSCLYSSLNWEGEWRWDRVSKGQMNAVILTTVLIFFCLFFITKQPFFLENFPIFFLPAYHLKSTDMLWAAAFDPVNIEVHQNNSFRGY